ncbi:hypothetical protein SEUCBS139899_002410 [Sporothrix eucalyptigena]|uniref:Uncharacterized protein n=1 Tax=Sporothrix eucalyptigena TaxID=1812306 RepID=A0ABP0B1D3_9PEZI
MATRKVVSPGAVLLRTSRFFSLPAELPPPPNLTTPQTTSFSESSTRPYPTMQTIGSPRASRKNGDWGLKRTMPPQANASKNTPFIRIREQDTFEAVTDYAPAADHYITLQKWQALNTPITSPTDAEQRQQLPGRSVFEESADVVAIDPAKRHTAEDKRWKFQGPWLAGISEGEFQNFLEKKVRTRRSEFREFLRSELAADRNASNATEAIELGSDATKKLKAADITDDDLMEYLRLLRHDRPTLYRLVGKFLDLVPVEPSDKVFQNLARSGGGFLSPLTGLSGSSSSGAPPSLTSLTSPVSAGSTGNPWAQDGPPITHPSAGLSYLRTAAYLDNHPLYGPQKSHPPLPSRVVQPRTQSGAWTAKIGVAGFITDNPFGESAYVSTRHNSSYNSSRAIPALSTIDPAVRGGAKIPVRIASAKINSQGRLVVTAGEADPEAVLVQEELEGKEKIYGQPSRLMSTRADSQPRRVLGRFGAGLGSRTGTPAHGQSVISSPENYGLN